MSDEQVASTENSTELLAVGRRHLAVKDFSAAVEALASACELLSKEHGDFGDQCAEAYLWYGKSLLGLSRQESGVFGDGLPGSGNAEEEDDDDDQEENGEDEQNGEAESAVNDEAAPKENGEVENPEPKPECTSKVEEPSSSKPEDMDEQPGTSNADANDESIANLDNEDDVDNLQLAWEMLDLSRNILHKRVGAGGGAAARALLADVLLALGEVSLESETYDKAVADMQSCLELQKELYGSDDRRIAETHYQLGLANYLASNPDDAITHYKNAANILESRIKTLENPTAAANDATVKKYSTSDPGYSVEGEIKELKELLPEIQEKIQDMMDCKAEAMRRIREALCPSNGNSSTNGEAASSVAGSSSAAGSAPADKPATNISHLIKRKRKASDSEEGSAPKKSNT